MEISPTSALPDRVKSMTNEQYNDWQKHFRNVFSKDPHLYSQSYIVQYLDQTVEEAPKLSPYQNKPPTLVDICEERLLRSTPLHTLNTFDLHGLCCDSGDKSNGEDPDL